MLEQIAENLYLIHGKNRGQFPYSHSILMLGDNADTTLVDTGCGLKILKKIKKRFRITSVINSHTHPDHSAGNWLFQDDNCPIYVPEEGFETGGNIVALSNRFAEPGWLGSYWQKFAVTTLEFKNCLPTHSYSSESQFDFREGFFRPIHTPGHTKDHYCFYESSQKIILAFDYDLTKFGPWYGHRESSIPEFKCSIEKLIDLNPRILISGHRGIIKEDIVEQLQKFLQCFDERDNRILSLLKAGSKTIEQLVEKAPIYGSFPYAEPLLRYWEGQMIKKHLKELAKQRKVIIRRDNEYFIK